MIIKLDLTVSDPAVIHACLERICCNGGPTHNCSTHFLTQGLKSQLTENLLVDNGATTAKIIAELAKYDSCRTLLFDECIFEQLIKNLSGTDLEVLAHSCRAIANLCYEIAEGQNLVVEKGGLDAVISILCNPHEEIYSDGGKLLRAAAIGLVLNLITQNPTAQAKVISTGLPAILLGFARAELDSKQVTNLSQHVILIFVTLCMSVPQEEIFTQPVCNVAVELLGICQGPLFYLPALEFLEDSSLADPVKLCLVKADLFELLSKQLEDHPKVSSEEDEETYAMIGRVLANILTGDEAMEYVYSTEHPRLLDKLIRWLNNEEYNIAYSSALCMGNIARTDKQSREIVEKGVHKIMLRWLKKENCNSKMQYAIFSTLRNLSIPKDNKKQLVADGILDTLAPFISLELDSAAFVIFKLVGTWRQLLDGQQPVAMRLGTDQKFLERLITWAEYTICPWVSAESLRLFCSLINVSRDKTVVETIVRAGGGKEITKLLTCEHSLMQMEAIKALTIGGTLLSGGGTDWDSQLVEASIGEKIKLNLETPNFNPQIFEAIFTLLDTLLKFEKLREHVKEVNLTTALEATIQSKELFEKLRPRLTNIKNIV